MGVILFRNLSIVTLDEEGTIYHDADLVISDTRISHIGKAPPGLEIDEVIDGHGRIAMPGLFNTHGHSPMAILRGWAETGYSNLNEWLNQIWQAESQMTAEDVYWGSALAITEMIRSGTVGFNDMYFHMDQVARVVRDSGLKAALGWGFFDAGSGADAPGFEETLSWLKTFIAEDHERINTYIAPHAPYTVSKETLLRVVEKAHELDTGVHTHLAETAREVEQLQLEDGLRPVQYANQLGLFDVPGGCVSAHTLFVNQDDIDILVEKGVHVAHCPITYGRLGYRGFPSLKPLLEAGVQVSLATDGPTSNATLDMFAVMRQAVLLGRSLEGSPTFINGDQALRLATQAGAKALRFPDSGVLQEGAPADLILVNMDVPHMRPTHNLVANLTFSAKGSDVTEVMVNGKWLMRAGSLQTVDEERILFEVERRAKNLGGSLRGS